MFASFLQSGSVQTPHIGGISGFNPVRPWLHSAWKRDPSSAQLVVHEVSNSTIHCGSSMAKIGMICLCLFLFFSVSVLPRLVRCSIRDM